MQVALLGALEGHEKALPEVSVHETISDGITARTDVGHKVNE